MMKQKHPQRLVEKKKEICESKYILLVFSAMISFRLFLLKPYLGHREVVHSRTKNLVKKWSTFTDKGV